MDNDSKLLTETYLKMNKEAAPKNPQYMDDEMPDEIEQNPVDKWNNSLPFNNEPVQSNDYIGAIIAQPRAVQEFKSKYGSDKYNELNNIVQALDEVVDRDLTDIHELDSYFPIDTCDDLLRYLHAYANIHKLPTPSKLFEKLKNLLDINKNSHKMKTVG